MRSLIVRSVVTSITIFTCISAQAALYSIQSSGELLGLALGERGNFYDINESNQIVGTWLFSGTMIEPDGNGGWVRHTLPSEVRQFDSSLTGINNHGVVVGWAERPFENDPVNGELLNFTYSFQTEQLAWLVGPRITYARIDDSGYVHSDNTYNGPTDLLSLLPNDSGWSSLIGTSMNSAGYIVGYGRIEDAPFNTYGFLMSPTTAVPVPAALWLFGSGLLGLSGIAKRKAAPPGV